MAKTNAVLKARNDGYAAGVKDTRKVVLDYLEAKYMADEVERGTPVADCLLEVTRELSALMNTPLPTKDPHVD